MIGAALFAVGSLVAALSTGVVSLVIGEAIIEGVGASLMLPATLGCSPARSRDASGRPRSRRGARSWVRPSRSAHSSAAS